MKITSFVGVSTGKVFPLNPETGKYRNLIKSSDPKLNGQTYCEYTPEYMLKNTPACYLVHTVEHEGKTYVVSGTKTEFFVVQGEPQCPLDDHGPVIKHFQDESGRTGDDEYGGIIKHFRD